jgi:outer membrane protein
MSRLKLKDRRLMTSIFGVAVSITFTVSTAIAADAVEQAPEPQFDASRFEAEPKQRDWTLILGAGGIYEPTYEGGDDFEVTPVPFVVFTYGKWLEIDPRGVTVTPFEKNGFSVSGKVGYEMGRDEDDDDRLRGLGDIDFAATVGAKIAYEWQGLEVYAAVDQTIDGSESLLGTFGVEYTAPVTERFFVGAEAKATIANDKHMKAYFGVNSQQAAASGLSEYKAEAGLKRVDVSVNATYALTQNWLVRGEAGVGFLTGDAADSPIVKEKTQPSASLFVGYKF